MGKVKNYFTTIVLIQEILFFSKTVTIPLYFFTFAEVLDFQIVEISTVFMVLFAVIDAVGSIPIIVALRQKEGKIESGKAAFIAGFIMVLFLIVGDRLLSFIGVDVNSFAVAGSLIMFFIALEMILGITLYKDDYKNNNNHAVFPIAFPLFAGLGSLTTLLSLRSEFKTENIIVGILLNVVLIYLVMKVSRGVEKVIGNNGIQVIRKIFGVVILAIAVKLFTANIKLLMT